MSLLPYLYSPRGQRLSEQLFGLNWVPEHLLDLASRDCFLPASCWHHLPAGVGVAADEDKFQVNVDVQHFSPDEITVTTRDGHVVVEACHEERWDEHGAVARRFVRRCALPAGCPAGAVRASVSADGVLSVWAPRRLALPARGERIVPVRRTGPVPRRTPSGGEKTEDKCAENGTEESKTKQ